MPPPALYVEQVLAPLTHSSSTRLVRNLCRNWRQGVGWEPLAKEAWEVGPRPELLLEASFLSQPDWMKE